MGEHEGKGWYRAGIRGGGPDPWRPYSQQVEQPNGGVILMRCPGGSKVLEVTRVSMWWMSKSSRVGVDGDCVAAGPHDLWVSAADGLRSNQQTKRPMSWHERDDGMIDFGPGCPKDEVALLIVAITTAKDQFGPSPTKPDPWGMPSRRRSGPAGPVTLRPPRLRASPIHHQNVPSRTRTQQAA